MGLRFLQGDEAVARTSEKPEYSIDGGRIDAIGMKQENAGRFAPEDLAVQIRIIRNLDAAIVYVSVFDPSDHRRIGSRQCPFICSIKHIIDGGCREMITTFAKYPFERLATLIRVSEVIVGKPEEPKGSAGLFHHRPNARLSVNHFATKRIDVQGIAIGVVRTVIAKLELASVPRFQQCLTDLTQRLHTPFETR